MRSASNVPNFERVRTSDEQPCEDSTKNRRIPPEVLGIMHKVNRGGKFQDAPGQRSEEYGPPYPASLPTDSLTGQE